MKSERSTSDWAALARRAAGDLTAAIPCAWAAVSSGGDWQAVLGAAPEHTSANALSVALDDQCSLVIGTADASGFTSRDRAALQLFARALHADHLQGMQVVEALIDAAAQGILGIDASGVIQFANSTAERLFGYDRHELIGRSVDILVPEAARTRHAAHRMRYSEGPVSRPMGLGMDLTGRRKDGTEFPVEISINSGFTDRGPLTIAFVTDISVRKDQERQLRTAHEQLRAEQERLHAVLENLPVGVTIAEAPDGKLVYSNRAMESIIRGPFRYSENVSRYGEDWVAFHPDGRRYEPQEFPSARTVLTGAFVRDEELQLLRPDGTHVWLSVNCAPVMTPGGEIAAGVLAATDVTDRKAAEENLRKSEASLALAQRLARLAHWSEDPRTGAVNWSPGVYEMLGMPPSAEPLTRAGFFARVPEEDRALVRNAFDQAVRKRSAYHIEHRILHEDGRVLFVREYAEPVLNERGEVTRMSGALQDITDVHQLENELRQAQKMDAIGQLAGGVAHDFNNLLTVIVGHAALGLSQVAPGEQVYARLTEISDAGEKAAALTQQLLAFSRKQLLRPRIIDLNQVVSQTHSMLRRLIGENIEVRLRLAPQLNAVKVDASQMVQVIVNLAVNARDAMRAGGTLTLATSNMRSRSGGRYVRLEVSDTGCGMEEKVLSRIFEPFFTTKPPGKGTGLGLSTVYGIVKQSGGEIFAASTPGKGTSFEIRLPVCHEPLDQQSAPDPIASGSGTVLVIEDEDGVRQLAQATLEQCGYAVMPAADGEEALELLSTYSGPLDLILMDVVMPRISGLELAAELRARHPAVPILFMSGYTSDAVLQRGIAEDEVPFLPKPFSPSSLAKEVAALIARSKPQST